MSYEIQGGLAGLRGLGMNQEFVNFSVPPKPPARTATTALRVAGVVKPPTSIAPSIVITPKLQPIATPNTVPAQAVPAVVNAGNASDPTAPPPMAEPEPMQTVVIEAPPAGPSKLVVGAGLLVASGVALYFLTRKGK